MFIVVAGCGRLGAGLARILSSQGHDVVVVGEDIDPRRLGAEFDGVTVAGNPVDEDLLVKAGIGKTDLFVAATADDRLNAMAVQVAREVFHVPMTLARISDPALELFYRGIGLDTVCPTSTSINQILDLIQKRIYSSLQGFIDPEVVGIRPPSEWLGLAPDELALPAGRRIAGVLSAGAIADFDPGRRIVEGDVLLLARAPMEGGAG